MSGPFRIACVQTNSGNDMAANLDIARDLALEARRDGADFIAFPECVSMMEMGRSNTIAAAAPADGHPALAAFADMAHETGAWLLAGSLTVDLGDGMVANRSYLLDPDGATVAEYDKIHMFDVDLADGESYRESALYRPGAKAVVADTPWGRVGMTVCYDLRFPYLYRALAHAGADYLMVPSAFTRQTGTAHWHVLLRARAIETGCYVFAPAQCGSHPRGRRTFGHSLIVDPWGEVLADGGTGVGIVSAEIDPAKVAKARAAVPSLTHDRDFV